MKLLLRAAALLSLTGLLLVSDGCGNRPAATPPARKEITFWHINVTNPTRKVIEDAVGRFEDAHPDAAVKSEPAKNDNYKQKLSQAMASGTAPDVFFTWGGGVLKSFVDQRQVADLTAAVASDNVTRRILPAALQFGTVRGKVYAVPMDVSAVVMWYNRDLFEKRGIRVPETFQELKSACAELRKAGITPIALGNKDKWPGAFYFVYLATRIGGTKPFTDAAGRAPGGTFEDPCFVQAGQALRELVNLKAFNDGANALSYDDARQLFVHEKAAMMLMGTWMLSDLRSDTQDAAGEASHFMDKVGCFAFPSVAEGRGRPGTIVGGINSAYAVSSRSGYPKESFDLLKELISDTTALKWAQTGRIPALRPEFLTGLLDPLVLPAARLLFDAPEIQLYYDQYLPPELAEMHKSATQSLIAGTQTAEEAARSMEKLASELASKSKSLSP
jgi:raffinose/stachyose/melibiose transport system substrate-binding protein